jgi:superfamily II DNA or RNA helicase
MVIATDAWRTGDRLLVRAERWTLIERTSFDDCEALRLQASRAAAEQIERTFLTPFDRPQPIHRAPSIAVLRPLRWLNAVRDLASHVRPIGGLQAAIASAVDLLPYQLEPALAMLRDGAVRMMIADAVGLGKTIQAGLILAELAQNDGFRGLVVAPAGLREQWSRELRDKFAIDASSADAEWLARVSRDLPADVNPWTLPGLYLASFDFIKRPEVLDPLEQVHWDIVIVDEAHGASLGTARRAAVHAVASRSKRVLLLTATPHAGDIQQFAALCRIGEVSGDSSPLLVFQRSRADAGACTARRTVVLPITPTDAERRMHRLLDKYSSRVLREAEAREDIHARLTAVVLKKRALSSAGSLGASARRRLVLLADAPVPRVEYQPSLPLSPDDVEPGDRDDELPDAVLAAPGLEDVGQERRWLAAIASVAENAARHESKRRLLLRFLNRVREPVLVFTEFRDTLEQLYRVALAAGHPVRRLHGGLSAGERATTVADFVKHGGLLLATDAASEGLNLHLGGHDQPGCRVVIHYELPWSPARLEQRTGRVDRIGQQRRVHEILFVADDTAEKLVLAPLAVRAARGGATAPFLSRLTDVLTESRVAAAVMDGTPLQTLDTAERADTSLDQVVRPSPSLGDEACAEVRRIAQQRVWRSPSRRRPRASGILTAVARLPRNRIAPGLVCIHSVSLAAGTGATKYRQLVCTHVTAPGDPAPRSSSTVRRTVRTFIREHEPAIASAALAMHAGSLSSAAALHAAAVARLSRRDSSISAAVPSTARELVQVGLFDGRALQALGARRNATGTLLDSSRELTAATTRNSVLASRIELVAVLIVCPGRR